MNPKNELERIKLFVAQMINDEQDAYSKMIDELKKKIGGTKQYNEVFELLTKIHEAKAEVLNIIYKEF